MDKVGKYLILGKLGQGGMGVVYRALDPLLERVVALKTINAHLDSQPELRARFFREGRSAAHLSHRNIITIYDIGEDNGVAYLAMEYLEGHDLKAKIAKRVNFSLQKKLSIMMEVCEGLAHAHSRQVIHRDIKPANIFLTNCGEIKILDFGLARMVSAEITRTGAPLGTPNYMSPEQVRGERADHRADIFSVGAVFYELLAFRRPFDEDSVPATIMKILQADPEPLEKIDASIDPALAAMVMKALAKEPDARYQSAEELLRELRRFAATLHPAPEEEDTAVTSSGGRSWTGEPLELPTIETPVERTPGFGSGGSERPRIHSAFTSPAPFEPANVSHARQKPASTPSMAAASAGSQPPPPAQRRVWGGIVAGLLVVVCGSAWWMVRLPRVPSAGNDLSAARSVQKSPAPPPPAPRQETRPVTVSPAPPTAAEESRALPRTPRERQTDEPASRPAELSAKPAERRDDLKAAEARLAAAAQKTAEEALRQMMQARSRAEAAAAVQHAAKSYEAARKVELEARALFDSGQFEKAGPRLFETSGLYASAALEAEARKEAEARQVEKDRETAQQRAQAELARHGFEQARQSAVGAGAEEREPSKFREASALATQAQAAFIQEDFAGAKSQWETATASMEQVRAAAVELARAPAPSVPEPPARPMPAPALSADSERQLIAASLQQYAAALRSRDVAAVKSIWPGISGKQEQALRAEFQIARDIGVQLLDIDIRPSGDAATATARRIYVLQTLDGRRLETSNKMAITLRKSGSAWLLDKIRFEPLH